jgi:hypothetical protein
MSLAIATTLIASSKRRRQVGGVNKSKAIKAFRSLRAYYNTGEPDSRSSRSEGDSPPKLLRKKRQITYSREKKL